MKDEQPTVKTDEQIEWLQEVIILNTPTWAHVLAMAAQFKGMQWMKYFPLPIVRYFTDLSIKTDTNMKPAGKGFRAGTMRETQHIRVFKRGRMLAEKSFDVPRFIKSPYSKL